MAVTNPAVGAIRLPRFLLLAPALFAYPAVAGLLARSELPQVLGRYSLSFFVFNLWSIALLLFAVWTWRSGNHRLVQLSQLLLIATTVVLTTNNQLRALAGITLLLPIIRLVAGLAVIVAGFDRQRRGLGRARGLIVGAGAIFVMLSALDLLLLGVIALGPQQRKPDAGLRVEYALERVSSEDIILVGDSFVWGQGVEKSERFGDRLQQQLGGNGGAGKVYSLGQLGAGLNQYVSMLEEVPAGVDARRVILAFYMNDMPAPERLRGKLAGVTSVLGYGFPSLRLVGDKLAKLLTVDVDAYHALVVDSYAPRDGFDARWALLGQRLATFRELAADRSSASPLLLVLPLMVDFQAYPLDGAHARLGRLAVDQGYETLDLLPVFRDRLGDGTRHRSGPDDNHFDAGVHRLVAELLFQRLERPPAGD